MTELLDEMDSMLADLMQSGFSTGARSSGARAAQLRESCSGAGLHTAAEIFRRLCDLLEQRDHLSRKDDSALMDQICLGVRYVELAREKIQQQSILDRWKTICPDEGEVIHESN